MMHSIKLPRSVIEGLLCIVLLAPWALLPTPWGAAYPTASVLQTLKGKVERALPGQRIDSVRATPVAGLFEVVSGRNVLYVNSDATYAFHGELTNLATKTNLTQTRLEDLNRVPLGTLPLDQAIKLVRGDGSRVMVTFEDPNCPYCARLHEALKEVGNVTVYTFVTPILSPDSNTKAKNILCDKDPAATWNRWMLERIVPPEAPDCKRPDAANVKLFTSLGAAGTPTIFFADGVRRTGSLPVQELQQMLNNHSSAAASMPFVKRPAFAGGAALVK